MIDVNPEIALKSKMVEAQKELTNGMVMLELLCKSGAPRTSKETQNDPTELVEGPVDAPKEETTPSTNLDKYGGPRKEVYDAFVYCVTRRKEMTIKFLTNHYTKVHEEERKRSMLSKSGGWIKNLIVWAVIAFIVGSSVYSKYQEHVGVPQTDLETRKMQAKSKIIPTGEELARMATEREAQEAAQRRRFEKEIDERYANAQEEDLLDRLTRADDL